MEKGKKKIIIQAIVCVVLLCLIWVGYYITKHYRIDRIMEIKEDDFSWVFQVESAKLVENTFVLSGFAFELNKDAERDRYEVVLQDLETGENFFLKTEYVERKDVNEYFLCEYEYVQSGFQASIKNDKFELSEKNLEVLIKKKKEKTAYKTGIYISNGEIVYANPIEFLQLEVKGTDLEKIVEEGVLRVYQPDYGMYVYQYEGALYWIAEAEVAFANGNTFVEYLLETTQVSKLPEVRLKNQWYSDNIGFEFSDNEMFFDTGKYRVAKKELPVEYSIVKIWTGNHTGVWNWRCDFRPYYRFE